MTAGLRPYRAMKDSGIQWLGKVPAHWEVKKLKHLGEVRIGLTYSPTDVSDEYGTLVLRASNIRNGRIVSVQNVYVSKKIPSSLVVNAGDILICVRSGSRSLVGKSAIVSSEFAGVTYGAFMSLLRSKLNRFIYWVLQSNLLPTVMAQFETSTINQLTQNDLRNLIVPFPPQAERVAMVRFLDRADRRIRRYIRAKQKLITLLEEERQAIIHRAVTRGLDPNVRLKPSGVEWLGDVPEHWDVAAAKFFYREVDERSDTGAEELLSVSHITGVTPRSQKNITMFVAASNVGHKICRPGDLVINTMWAWMAALGVAKQTGIVSPSYAVYRPRPSSKLLGEYADLLLRTAPYRSEYLCRSTGIRLSRLRLYPEQFLRIKLLCPSPDEQRALIEIVGRETANARHAIDLAQGEIALLREYRTRLIADIVTGKLDVREAATNLPDAPTTTEDEQLSAEEASESDAAELDDAEADVTA